MTEVDAPNIPEREPVERRIIFRDGSMGMVTLERQDPPEAHILLDQDNHWYKWNQKLGAYKWYSHRKPLEVRRREVAEKAADKEVIVIMVSAVVGGVGLMVALIVAAALWGPFF